MITGSSEDKKRRLQEIHQMGRKSYDLVPASQAVKSAIQHIVEIEKFFQKKSHNQAAVYPLLAAALNGYQDDSQPNMISGRLFYNLSCFVQKDESKNIMEKANKEFSTNNAKKYNFVSEEMLENFADMLKTKDITKVDGIIDSIVKDIDSNPAWIQFWQKRVGTEGVDNALINKVTQALVYKMTGACHEAYVKRFQPSYDEQLADTRFIRAFKTSALQVNTSLDVENLLKSKMKQDEKDAKSLLKRLNQLASTSTQEAHPIEEPTISNLPSPIATQFTHSQASSSQPSSHTSSSGKVKKMVEEYQDKHIRPK
ncbi:hypothetical protein [Candidatus Berkiella aquae]|uniref:Uncharacterized protein n=1 Tax=Candidatus Berkiella aquae TaxID=295108 RepID=A0A0Q9YSV4_9GAMM|nr:hypothetical protein [Candidatus Berkiella aquae]MCS5711278.1 hypothetical protein [Candidatus Berkiella aquae]